MTENPDDAQADEAVDPVEEFRAEWLNQWPKEADEDSDPPGGAWVEVEPDPQPSEITIG